MPQNDILHSQTQTQGSWRNKSSSCGKRAARELLLLCTTANISSGSKERICQILAGTVDWKYLLELAEFHGVAPLISHNLVTNGLASRVPQSHLERLNRIYNGTLCRNLILSNELIKVLSVFSQNGISSIILKGTILAEQLYGNPGLRTVADIDILVRPEELSRASSFFLEMGYQKLPARQGFDHPFHVVYYKKEKFPFFIELHWNLDDQRLVTIPLQELWNRAQLVQIESIATMILTPEDTLLYLSNNLTKRDNQVLRSLCDITELLKKYDGVLDWKYIIKSITSWGIGTHVYYSLRRSKELLGAPAPASVVSALKPKPWRWWLLDFLISRDFFVSATAMTKLKAETYVIFRSLMMKHARQMLYVLSKFRNLGRGGMIAWLRTVIWIVLVFSAAVGRNTARFLIGGSDELLSTVRNYCR